MASTAAKRAILAAAVARLEREAEALRASARATREAATHEESRAENAKDTRGLEASYLARGQAMRVEETEEAATRLRFLEPRAFAPDDAIALTALVDLEIEDAGRRRYLLVPVGGGTRVEQGGVEVWLVTPAAPLGRALIDKRAGDVFELPRRGALREHEILSVR